MRKKNERRMKEEEQEEEEIQGKRYNDRVMSQVMRELITQRSLLTVLPMSWKKEVWIPSGELWQEMSA